MSKKKNFFSCSERDPEGYEVQDPSKICVLSLTPKKNGYYVDLVKALSTSLNFSLPNHYPRFLMQMAE